MLAPEIEVVVDESPHAIVVQGLSIMLFKMNSFLRTSRMINRFLKDHSHKDDEQMADLLRTRLDQEKIGLLTLGAWSDTDVWLSLQRAFEELDEFTPLYQQLLSLSKAVYAAQTEVQHVLASLAAASKIS